MARRPNLPTIRAGAVYRASAARRAADHSIRESRFQRSDAGGRAGGRAASLY